MRRTVIVLAGLMTAGCSATAIPALEPLGNAADRYEADADWLGRDPIGYLRNCLKRCRQIKQYSLILHRQERLGLIPVLGRPERIRVLYRAEPLSIKMTWLDPHSQCLQSLYVRGRNDDKMLLLPRQGLFGGPAAVGKYDLTAPLAWGKAKRPMTEFGLVRMLERTLEAIERARRIGPVRISYLGLKQLKRLDQPVHHVQIHYPPDPELPYARQDLLIGALTRLPAGTALWLPDGRLDASYLYSHLNLEPALSDEDFAIDLPASQRH